MNYTKRRHFNDWQSFEDMEPGKWQINLSGWQWFRSVWDDFYFDHLIKHCDGIIRRLRRMK